MKALFDTNILVDHLSGIDKFTLLPLDARVSARAVALRRKSRIKLPDAIIWATALAEDRLLVTRNVKDFPAEHPGVRIPYSVLH